MQGAVGTWLDIAVNFACPAADVILVAVALIAMAVAQWRPGPAWLLPALAAISNGVIDGIDVVQLSAAEPLTGFANHRAFHSALAAEVQAAAARIGR